MTVIIIPRKKQTATVMTAANGSRLPRPVIPALMRASRSAGASSRIGCHASEIKEAKMAREAR